MNLLEWLEEQETTKNPCEAIFILKDGTLIDGQFDYGSRGLDHNCIIALAPDELSHPNKWEFIHKTYNIVRLVPETQYALILKGQKLNAKQSKIVISLGYDIEEY